MAAAIRRRDGGLMSAFGGKADITI